MPTAVQAGDAGGFLQDAATVGRLGGDQFGDLALPHKRRRIGAGGGVGEQQLHVPRPGLHPVDAIGGALAAVDAAGHLQHRMIVELRRRGAVAVVDLQKHFSVVAGRPIGRAAEDHVVHALAAHGLGGGCAHHPAERFQEVGLPATVRPHDAGQARLYAELGGLDEGLEAGKAQALEMQGASLADYFSRGWMAESNVAKVTSPAFGCLPLIRMVGVEST